jgi:oligopeptide transport system substrate-binding protein
MKLWIALMFGVIMVFTSSCQNSHQSSRQPHQLNVNISGEPATLDPRKGADLISSSLHFMLFEGLTKITPDGSTVPAQAEKIDLSLDCKTYTFHLRECRWSDGTPVTAYDFEKAWKDILDPQFPAANAHLFYPIRNAEAAKKGKVTLQEVGIRVKDPKTLVVELENPTPYFLELTQSTTPSIENFPIGPTTPMRDSFATVPLSLKNGNTMIRSS